MVDHASITFFEQLYEDTYASAVLFVTRRCGDPAQIPDILQETYTEVYRVLLRKGRAYFKNPQALVLHIAKTRLHRYYSWKEHLRCLVPLFCGTPEDEAEYENPQIDFADRTVEEQLEDRAQLAAIWDCVRRKPPLTQKIFYLYYYLDLTTRQIALELGMNESTVKSRLYRTVAELRKLYGKDGAENDGKRTLQAGGE